MMLRSTAVFAALLACAPQFARAGAEDAAIWDALKGGGQVILMRHTVTMPGVGDPPGMRVDDTAAVSNSFGRSESEMPRQVREMRSLAGGRRRGGGNVVLVSHATTIQNVTGLAIAPGEMVIVTPRGDGQFELRGKLMAAAP